MFDIVMITLLIDTALLFVFAIIILLGFTIYEIKDKTVMKIISILFKIYIILLGIISIQHIILLFD